MWKSFSLTFRVYIFKIFIGRGSIIFGKEKSFEYCATSFRSGYWQGWIDINGNIYAPTIDGNLINSGKLYSPRTFRRDDF